LLADLKEFDELNNLILDEDDFRHRRFYRKKDEDNLLDACRGLSKEGISDLVDVIGM